ncbi:MAG: insulinase family protein [Clostridium sp.]|nr:insulinase family protein [Clostridium sp.]
MIKKVLRAAMLLMAGATLLPAAGVSAQQLPTLPVDTVVRIGQLDNGLTYYIRHNEYPKGQADFYIAQKVGSILEEDNQRGLAHFLEHMCFNGTKNFPANRIVEWCETVGIKFGQNLNAYTGVDQTVYNISNVPVARQGVQDSCLMILHDWADDLLLDGEEIDKERGVIHEEWRRSMTGQMRILESMLPTLYPDSPYGYRLPIGTMEVVDNFDHQALRDYYEKWYRPDQQGVIVVGDIDVDYIEAKIKELFSPIRMPENPAERRYFEVPDTKGTIVAVGHDKEQQNNIAYLELKTDAFPDELKNTPAYYAQSYVLFMIQHMLNARLSEIGSKPDAPFAAAGVNYGNYILAKTKDALSLIAIAKDGNVKDPLAAVYREFVRAAKGGFTQTEYDRAKEEYLSSLERAYNNRNTRENNQFVQAYVNNFLDNEPIPPIDIEKQLGDQIAAMIPLQAINQTVAEFYKETATDNRVIYALLSDNETGVYVTEDEILNAVNAVDAEDIAEFVDNVKTEPLIPALPAAGKIVSEKSLDQFGAKEWTLSNGARVILKQTSYKEDEILFSATEVGRGTSDFGTEYINSVTFLPVALQSVMGLGEYTSSDLEKYLSGKQVSFNFSFNLYRGTAGGMSTPKDLKTLMEFIYMGFTNFTIDPEEYQALQATYAGLLHNQETNPQYQFQKFLTSSLYPSGAVKTLSAEVVEKASREQIVEIVRNLTANAADYTFTFVGNFDEATLRQLAEQYIATIPGNAKTAVRGVRNFSPKYEIAGGTATDRTAIAMETPTTWAAIIEWAENPYTSKYAKEVSAIGDILGTRLLKSVREEKGAVYSIGADGSVDRIGKQNTMIQTAFPMKPEMEQEVLDIITGELRNMENDITEEELAPVREYELKEIASNREKNSGWLGWINGWLLNGVNSLDNAENLWNNMTAKDLMETMKKINNQNNLRIVVVSPAK